VRGSLLIGLAALASSCGSQAMESDMTAGDGRTTPLPRPRDGNIAIQQELDAARRAATLEAYDLFIARHPGHPLEAVARRERAALARQGAKPKA
jgi:hypothetical protein